jgi:hypothetical protein
VDFPFWLLDFFVSGRGTCLSVRHAAEKGVLDKKQEEEEEEEEEEEKKEEEG